MINETRSARLLDEASDLADLATFPSKRNQSSDVSGMEAELKAAECIITSSFGGTLLNQSVRSECC